MQTCWKTTLKGFSGPESFAPSFSLLPPLKAAAANPTALCVLPVGAHISLPEQAAHHRCRKLKTSGLGIHPSPVAE